MMLVGINRSCIVSYCKTAQVGKHTDALKKVILERKERVGGKM